MAIQIDPSIEEYLKATGIETDDKKDKDIEYIKSIIKKGLDQCERKVKAIDDLIDNMESYDHLGIESENIITMLEQLKYKFEVVAPAILIGDFDKLFIYEDTSSDKKEIEDIYKNARKKPVNNLIKTL